MTRAMAQKLCSFDDTAGLTAIEPTPRARGTGDAPNSEQVGDFFPATFSKANKLVGKQRESHHGFAQVKGSPMNIRRCRLIGVALAE